MILNYGNKLVSPVMLAAPLMRNDTPLSNNFIKIIRSSLRFAVFAFCICVLCLYFVFCILYFVFCIFVSRNYTSLRNAFVKVVESSAESSLPTTL